jgi:hypothetical protein
MKKEGAIVLAAVAVLVIAGFVGGRRYERSSPEFHHSGKALEPSCKSDEELKTAWSECIDDRRREQTDYLIWRGKHIQQLEACTSSLGEATHALVRRHP